MWRNARTGLTVLVVAALLMAGITAFGQEGTTSTTEQSDSETTSKPQGRRGHDLVSVIAEAIGVTPAAVIAHWRQGGTVDELAKANGTTGQAVVDKLTVHVKELVDQAVADGRIEQERAATILARSGERLQRLVFEEHPFKHLRHRLRHRAIRGSADVIGIDASTLRTALRSGQSLLEVAQANGLTEQQLIDGLLNRAETRLERAVTNGRIDEARQRQLLEKLADGLPEVIRRHRGSDPQTAA